MMKNTSATKTASASPALTAARHGLLSCHTCGLLCMPAAKKQQSVCPRCAGSLHLRKPDSVARTWAFLITGLILYIPANLLPIMEARSLQDAQIDTIMSGVIYLWVSGSWPLAVIVFVASILVPCFKLIALGLLTISVQWRSAKHPMLRTRLYRAVDFIGRWSMLDIYVVALLVAFVQLKLFATVRAGPGAAAFGAVVILTIFAARSFDPRLIWDFVDTEHD